MVDVQYVQRKHGGKYKDYSNVLLETVLALRALETSGSDSFFYLISVFDVAFSDFKSDQ